MRELRSVFACFIATAAVGCGAGEESPINPLDGQTCVGVIEMAPSGVQPVDDPPLLQDALGKSGDGKLCAGQVYMATQPITVYRVWNSAKTYTEYGRWWSLTQPMGPVDQYRMDNAICPEWSELNQLTVCKIKVGAHFVLGPGQSAQCMAMLYAKSAVNQVYIPNDTRVNQVYVEGCTSLGTWPN